MKLWLPLLVCALLAGGIYSCKKASNSPIPFLAFTALSPDSVKSGNPLDTTYLTFHFSDGDGDLGRDVTKGEYDVFLHDMRYPDTTQFPLFKFPFPPIPDGAIDPINGITGDGAIALTGNILTVREDTVHKYAGDTTVLQMWIMDRAQHASNIITTTTLYIRP